MTDLRRAALAAVLALVAGAAAVPAPAGAATLPDLRTTAISRPPAVADAGDTVTVRTTVRNAGRKRAPATSVRTALSRDRAAGRDVTVATTPVPALAPGRSAVVTTRLRVPRSATGAYYVLSCADAGRRVRETNEHDNCRASAARLTVRDVLDATLQGSLEFVDAGETTGSGETTTWRRDATVQVRMTVRGGWQSRFRNAGSSFTYEGRQVESFPDPPCPRTITRDEVGGGLLEATGDPFADEIYAWFGRTDLGKVRLGVLMPHEQTTTDVDCEGSSTDSGGALIVNSLELTKIASTASTITYRVTGSEEELGIPSRWDQVTGTLTLRRR
jgi:hypothetical protein